MEEDKKRVKLLLSEDISPHKITLLFLIELYCNRKIPHDLIKPLLQFLSKCLENEILYDEEGNISVVPNLDVLLYNLKISLVGKDGSNVTQMSYDESRTNRVLNFEEIRGTLLKNLWSIYSIENLDAHMDKFRNLIAPMKTILGDSKTTGVRVSPRSSMGIFIQRLLASFYVIKFDESLLLFESFVGYRETTRDLYTSLEGKVESEAAWFDMHGDKNSDKNHDLYLFQNLNSRLNEITGDTIPMFSRGDESEESKLLPVSKHDLQSLLNKQIRILEAYSTPTPQELRKVMELMTSPNSYTCLIQNINFNFLPSYHYIKYLECLHDSDYNGAFEALHQYFDYMVSNNSKYFYHFALICRASLHQYFGEDDKAVDAIEAAISVARENKDNSTLTYILSWLFDFMKNKPELWKKQSFYNNNNPSQLLEFLTQKSHQVSFLLYSMSYNFEALQIMDSGGPMYKYLESLLKAMYISINDLVSSFIKSTEVSATIWNRVGAPHLSNLYNELSAKFSSRKADQIATKIRGCYLSFDRGRTGEAFKELDELRKDTKNDNAMFNTIQTRYLIIAMKTSLMKGRLKTTEEFIEILLSNDIKEAELYNELILLKIEVEIALGNYSKASELVSEHLYLHYSTVYSEISFNLMKCKIFNLSGNSSRGITSIIYQIRRGQKRGYQTIVAEGVILLVSILTSMGYLNDSYNILFEVMPLILFSNNKGLISQAYYEFARTCLKLYHKSKNDSKIFSKVLRYLNISILGFKESTNLPMLTQCLKLEKEIANLRGEPKLVEHSKQSLEKLSIRGREECSYGFVLKK